MRPRWIMKLLTISYPIFSFRGISWSSVKTGCKNSSSLLSLSIHGPIYKYVEGFVGGYKLIFLVESPCEIGISPDLQIMNALTVANHGLPRING